MAVRNLSYLLSLLSLRGEIIFTLDQVKANPLTQSYVPIYEGLRGDWGVIFAEDLALRDSLSQASARLQTVRATLNALASCVSKAVLTVTGESRKHTLYGAYFRKRSLSQFRRLAWGLKLEAMEGWIMLLKGSDIPALVELGAEVETAMAAVKEVMAKQAALEAELSFFRLNGNRKKLFDKVNAVRKQTHGELAKMSHEKVGVRASFANLFFLHESSRDEEEPTFDSVDEAIARLEKELAEQKKVRKGLEVKAEQEAKAKAEEAARQAQIEALEKVEVETRAKLAALRGERG